MKIKIKVNAASLARLNSGEQFYRRMKQIEGTEVEVDTKNLFADQFNTLPIPGVSEIGMRIMAQSVEAVINDERPGKARCLYCGQTTDNKEYIGKKVCMYCHRRGTLLPFVLLPGQIVVCWANRETAYLKLATEPNDED